MFKYINQINEEAFLLDFGSKIDIEINTTVNLFAKIILNSPKKIQALKITNIVPSYNKILIRFDPSIKKKNKIIDYLKSIKISQKKNNEKSKIIEIPVCYDDKYAIDLNYISKITNLNKNEIIDLHTNTLFHVYMIGFLPGLPFMGNIDKIVNLPRKLTPRINIPKGSIGIVDNLCVIYPQNSPGGWNIIGRTPVEIFPNVYKNSFNINAGDKIKFKMITKNEFINYD